MIKGGVIIGPLSQILITIMRIAEVEVEEQYFSPFFNFIHFIHLF